MAQPGSFTTAEDTPATGAVVATDVDSPTLTYAVVTPPAHGTVLLNATTGAGGTYPDGIVRWPAGTYYWDPIDLSPGAGYARVFDATKPNNNTTNTIQNRHVKGFIFDLQLVRKKLKTDSSTTTAKELTSRLED